MENRDTEHIDDSKLNNEVGVLIKSWRAKVCLIKEGTCIFFFFSGEEIHEILKIQYYKG